MGRWSRRRFLAASSGFPFLALALAPDEELVAFSDYGPEFRTDAQAANPRVKCFDLRTLTSAITPADDFFAFHQTSTISADSSGWQLRIGGLLKRPIALSLEDFLNRPDRRTVTTTIECSGNTGDPRIMNGLVSTASWSGVSLAAVLKECSLSPEAREVVFLGMDSEEDKKFEAGNTSYLSPHGWSLYVQDALAEDNLLAFGMNGKPLPPEHGFPLRLIMPGWYGMAQIKWLTRIEVIDRPYEGRQMARNYQSLRAIKSPAGTLWLDSSISRNNLKSVIARVTRRPVGERFEYNIAGAAWGGPARIAVSRFRSTEARGVPRLSITARGTPHGSCGPCPGSSRRPESTVWFQGRSTLAATSSPRAISCAKHSSAIARTTRNGRAGSSSIRATSCFPHG